MGRFLNQFVRAMVRAPQVRTVYTLEVRHPGLNKYRLIRGKDKAVVEERGRVQVAAWNRQWEEQRNRDRRRQEKRQPSGHNIRKEQKRARPKGKISKSWPGAGVREMWPWKPIIRRRRQGVRQLPNRSCRNWGDSNASSSFHGHATPIGRLENAAAVEAYCEHVVRSATYPRCVPKEWLFGFDFTTRVLVMKSRLPSITDLPTLKEVRYMDRGQPLKMST